MYKSEEESLLLELLRPLLLLLLLDDLDCLSLDESLLLLSLELESLKDLSLDLLLDRLLFLLPVLPDFSWLEGDCRLLSRSSRSFFELVIDAVV